ncbi:PREDICTED: F-box/LRR-repeat protein At5g38396-like [Camelina sativa]|uniref:F-box/LRR-repeat protein At5g38396-like n=1 Tax=Camelina sativa TaxID=90675 RepID=A0ABM1R2Y1_CAMSA|nr:PREDICTED: F-box/LRR-repeat protein At5g38396-like [Camelina sativa]
MESSSRATMIGEKEICSICSSCGKLGHLKKDCKSIRDQDRQIQQPIEEEVVNNILPDEVLCHVSQPIDEDCKNRRDPQDCLSILPDELLCHVLSFLTTKEAALTSVISKRWRNLFAFVHNLDIDESVFLHPGKRQCNITRRRFQNFVNRVLALQGTTPIKKFSLKCTDVYTTNLVDGWISNVLARGVSELDLKISLHLYYEYLLSSKNFQSNNLVKLKLDSLYIDGLPGGIFLPMPKLEELVLVDIISRKEDINVSNASLKSLTIDNSFHSGTYSFDTPSLIYFSYTGFVVNDYTLVNMENLSEAQIRLLATRYEVKRARAAPNNDHLPIIEGFLSRFTNLGKLMNGIRNVRYLDLSGETLEVLSLCCESIMPVFTNLKSLTIKSDASRGWQALPVLIRNCPHLGTLVIEGLLHQVTYKCGDACDCVSREDKGRSLTSCPVKLLEIKAFQGRIEEMHMIKHFLDYFPCLKEIKIYMERNGSTQLKDPETSEVIIIEKMKLYNTLYSCNVQLLVTGNLYKK